ncbi:MAG: hypothetical protein M2R45_01453 [Verrucomicrobia subdivision 3 bacterium]|nr:hypothetical protein [Limisphaerales bacterium]MCS1417602.1 hypothetical protein [Limisphaerales bacterium]
MKGRGFFENLPANTAACVVAVKPGFGGVISRVSVSPSRLYKDLLAYD